MLSDGARRVILYACAKLLEDLGDPDTAEAVRELAKLKAVRAQEPPP